MEKLESIHLKGYLPYRLRFRHIDKEELGGAFSQEAILETLSKECATFENSFYSPCDKFFDDENVEIKPILRPLSDLTKEIEINGFKFIPLIKLAKKYADSSGYNYDIKIFRNKCFCFSKSSEVEFYFTGVDFKFHGKVVSNQLNLFEKLYEWHFDVYDLIHNGLAININKLKL